MRPLLSEGGAPGGVGAFGFVLDPVFDRLGQTLLLGVAFTSSLFGSNGFSVSFCSVTR